MNKDEKNKRKKDMRRINTTIIVLVESKKENNLKIIQDDKSLKIPRTPNFPGQSAYRRFGG